MKVYRLIVDGWPTPDGQPWARFYGDDPALYGQRIDPDDPGPLEIPEWLEPLLQQALPYVYGFGAGSTDPLVRIARRLKWDDRNTNGENEVVGVLMPKVSRKNYLSASGAHELARDMEAFGATVRVIASKPVEWEDAS